MTKLIFASCNFENAPKIDVSSINQGRFRILYSSNTRYDLLSLYTCLLLVVVVLSCLGISNIDLNNVKKLVGTAKYSFPVSDTPPMLHIHI